jgi:hypothetical protein
VTENLPAPAGPRLPATYEAAKQALAECTRVDECKDWADKAAALASYARQRDDQTLHNLAQRIQLRAIRRIGELSKQLGIEQPRDESGRLASSGKTAKWVVLRAAGVSTSAAHRAERVAGIPEEEFEEALSSATPPTVTALAERGTVRRALEPHASPVPADPAQVVKATALLREFAAFCGTNDPVRIACSPGVDTELARGCISTIERWLDSFVTRLPDEEAA